MRIVILLCLKNIEKNVTKIEILFKFHILIQSISSFEFDTINSTKFDVIDKFTKMKSFESLFEFDAIDLTKFNIIDLIV